MKTILFADDDALVARIYRDKLSAEGFHVTVAEDGVAAIKKLVELKPDVLVLDLLMPKLNGADVLKFIREHPVLNNTPVIVFSNSFLAALVERVGDLGVEGAPEIECDTFTADRINSPGAGSERAFDPLDSRGQGPSTKRNPIRSAQAGEKQAGFRKRNGKPG